MNDLIVTFKSAPGTIDNSMFDEIKTWSETASQELSNVEVSLDLLPSAKKSLAQFRKLKEGLEDERKRIKREWNAPYLDWETKYKEAISSLDESISVLDSNIKRIEDEEAKKRIAEINEDILADLNLYNLINVVDKSEALKHRVYKDSYYLKSSSLKKCREDWISTMGDILNEQKAIDELDDNMSDMVYRNWIQTGNLSLSLGMAKRDLEVIAEKRRIQEEREAQKKAQEEAMKAELNKMAEPQNEPIQAPIEEPVLEPQNEPTEPLKDQEFILTLKDERTLPESELNMCQAPRRIIGPKYKIRAIIAFMQSIGLTVENINQN